MTGASPALYKPILRYPGGKARIAPWIAAQLPPHNCYVEPFCGAASVLFAKPRASVEVISDLDERVVNLFRVIRERPDELARAVALTPYARREYELADEPTGDPVEAARRYVVRCWMAHAGRMGSKPGWRCGLAGSVTTHRGSIARVWTGVPERILAVVDRLQEVMVECRPALDVIRDWGKPDALLFCDPPYLWSTRGRGSQRGRHYRHEMTDADHEELLAALLAHPGPVALSGYRSPRYDDALRDWDRRGLATLAYRNSPRVESLWLNPMAAERARQPALMGIER